MRPIFLPAVVFVVLSVILAAVGPAQVETAGLHVTNTLDIDTVPSWFPVGFCLLTDGSQQYVAYYNAEHQMIIAKRRLDSRQWHKVQLPSKVGWDSHNYVTMATDGAGNIHLSGNMHCVPLVYFRTQQPGDIETFQRLVMTGQEEQRCTYPRFFDDADGNLLFMYRSGGSGNGRRFCNIYDVAAQKWDRFVDSPLFEGQGKRNAYPHGPVKGPDGLFHIVWVWRDTPDCATNHHLCYARSRDLRNWEAANGKPLRLPLTLEQADSWVDPIPINGGLINGCEKLAFDSENRAIISYHKLDENSHMQIYVTRFQDGRWTGHPVTQWDKAIAFGGRGAMPFIGIRITGLKKITSDMQAIRYRHRDYGSGQIVLTEKTLQPVEWKAAIHGDYPRKLLRPTVAIEGMHARIAADLGTPDRANRHYVLRWETLDAHHDRPRRPPLPPASTLQLVTLERTE
jgi:hypothetical protein